MGNSRPVWSRCVRSSSSHLSISVGNVYTVLVTAVFRQLASWQRRWGDTAAGAGAVRWDSWHGSGSQLGSNVVMWLSSDALCYAVYVHYVSTVQLCAGCDTRCILCGVQLCTVCDNIDLLVASDNFIFVGNSCWTRGLGRHRKMSSQKTNDFIFSERWQLTCQL